MKQMTEKKQKSKEQPTGEAEQASAREERNSADATTIGALDERMLLALHAASDKKALDVIALDLRAVASFTEYFLITSGANIRQVQAIADEILERLKKELGERAARVEGYKTAEWVLLDYGDFIVHVFEDKARRFYDLERLWRDAGRVQLPSELIGAGGENDKSDSSRRHQDGVGSAGSLRNEQ